MSSNCINCGAPRETDVRAACSYCNTPAAISLTQVGSAFSIELRENIKNNLSENKDNESADDISLSILYLLSDLQPIARPIIDRILQNNPQDGRALILKSVCLLKETGIRKASLKTIKEVTSMLNLALNLDEGTTHNEVHQLLHKMQEDYFSRNSIKPPNTFDSLYEKFGPYNDNAETFLDEIL